MTAAAILPTAGETLNVLGQRQRLILTGADTDGTFTLIEQISDPGATVPVHYHEHEEETFQVLEGEVRFHLEGENLTVGPGSTVFVPRGARHGLATAGDVPARLLIFLSPSGAEAMFRELAALPPDSIDPAQVASLCAGYGVIFVSE